MAKNITYKNAEDREYRLVYQPSVSRIIKYLHNNTGISKTGLKFNDAILTFAKLVFNEDLSSKPVSYYREWVVLKYDEINDLRTLKTLAANTKSLSNVIVPVFDRSESEKYSEFLKTAYWRNTRKMILLRDGNKCTKCGCKQALQIHHKTYKNHLNEQDNLDDLITLCVACHYNAHKALKHV